MESQCWLADVVQLSNIDFPFTVHLEGHVKM